MTHLVHDRPHLRDDRALLREAILVSRRSLELVKIKDRRAAYKKLQLPWAKKRKRRTFADIPKTLRKCVKFLFHHIDEEIANVPRNKLLAIRCIDEHCGVFITAAELILANVNEFESSLKQERVHCSKTNGEDTSHNTSLFCFRARFTIFDEVPRCVRGTGTPFTQDSWICGRELHDIATLLQNHATAHTKCIFRCDFKIDAKFSRVVHHFRGRDLKEGAKTCRKSRVDELEVIKCWFNSKKLRVDRKWE